MNILAIYPNAGGYSRIPTGLAILVTLLDRAGHKVQVFDTTFMTAQNTDNLIREQAGIVKDTQPLVYETLSAEQITALFDQQVKQADAVMVSVVEDNYKFADSLLAIAKKHNKVVLAGGTTPTVAPGIMIENPNIDYICQGEGEETVLEFFDCLETGKDPATIQNIWNKKGNNKLRPFIDMESVPFQDLSFWDDRHLLKPYDGSIYKTGYVETSRGCPYSCSYCVNHAIRRSLKRCGTYYRQKSFKRAIAELKQQKELYNIERAVFCDDNFLLCSDDLMFEFFFLWQQVNLPFWICASAESISPVKLSYLKRAGCDGIGIGVEAGGEWYRQNILNRSISDEKLVRTFKMIKEAGIRTTANIMIGFPAESEADIYNTFRLIKRLKPDSIDVSFVAPYVGTKIYGAAKYLGLIEIYNTPGFETMAKNISFREHPSINNLNITVDKIKQFYLDAFDYIYKDKPIPDVPVTQNHILATLIKEC